LKIITITDIITSDAEKLGLLRPREKIL